MLHTHRMELFACRASKDFAVKVIDCLNANIRPGEPTVHLGELTVTPFSDGEFQPLFEESVRGATVYILQSTVPPADNLMELLLCIDAAKRASADKVIAVIPYFGWARQDRKDRPRVAIGAKLVANLLAAAGADRVMTCDLHADQIQGFFDIPLDNMRGQSLFVKYYLNKFPIETHENLMVVSPDVGSVGRARRFAQSLHMNLAIVDKRREKANQCEVMNVIGDVRGKDCIILDDMVDTAGSLCNAAKALVEVGGAHSVFACATHGLLSGPAIQRIMDSPIEEMVFLDTIPLSEEAKACPKIKQISCTDLFAEAIRRTYEEIGFSGMF